MPIDWTKVRGLKNKQEIEAYLGANIKASNYGIGKDCWTLTEIISERSDVAESALRIISGVDIYGKEVGAGSVKDENGLPLRYKLRVLTRQACADTKDGKGINNWNSTESKPENDNNELCPGPQDPPVEGDRVWIKGDPITHDPITGERLVKRIKLAMKARLEAELGRQVKSELAYFYYNKVAVDKDGCISVDLKNAMQLLTTKGKRLVLPQFASGRRVPENTRQITNWRCEEVPPNKQKNSPQTTRT
jgi:hypothetical protein